MVPVCGTRSSGPSAVSGWAGVRQMNFDCNSFRSIAGVVSGAGLAHGSMSFVCTRRIPMVSSLAATISDVGLDAADHHLDREHYPDIRPMAFARTWASVGGASWLGNAAGIRMRGSSRDHDCTAPAAPRYSSGLVEL
jgi:hypothetical protein